MKLTEKLLDERLSHFLTELGTKNTFIRDQFFKGMKINSYDMDNACKIVIETLFNDFNYHEDIRGEQALQLLGRGKFISLFTLITEETAKILKITIDTDSIEAKLNDFVDNDFLFYSD